MNQPHKYTPLIWEPNEAKRWKKISVRMHEKNTNETKRGETFQLVHHTHTEQVVKEIKKNKTNNYSINLFLNRVSEPT